MKNKSISFEIPLVTFPFSILCSIGQSDADFNKAVIKYLPEDAVEEIYKDGIVEMETGTDGRTVNLSTSFSTIIRLKKYPTTPRDIGILSHEIFHAITYILWRMSIPFEMGKTDEVYAYLIDYVTTEIHKRL